VGGATDLPDAATGAAAPDAGPTGSASASNDTAVDAPIQDWRVAVRSYHWERALELIEALPASEREQDEVRLARGRCALGLAKHADAVKALEGLGAKLPSVRVEIQRWYAEAASIAGPHDEAAKLLQGSAKVVDLLLAAQSWQRAGDNVKARKVADRAVKRAQRVRRKGDEGQAHMVRASIAEAGGAKAVAAGDFQWFVKHRQRDPRVRDALAGVDRLGGVVSIQQRIDALAASTNQLNLDETLKTLDALATKHSTQALQIKLARARAIYNARDYAQARDAFVELAATPSGFVAEAKYYAARATVRTGDQEAGAAMYDEVARRFRKNGFAERAAYRHAETLLLVGQYDAAATAFARYSSRFGKTKSSRDARYGRAIALLSAGKAAQARKLLAALRKAAKKRRRKANLRHLEGLAALRAGDADAAKKIWLALINEQPLTYPAMAAHARLQQISHTPMPPLMPEPRPVAFSPLPITLPAGPNVLTSLGLDFSAEQRLFSMEQSVANGYPGRESEALCEMYGKLNGAQRRYRVGSRAVSLAMLMRAPTIAERWAWHCVYPGPFGAIVKSEEERYSLPNGIVHSIMRQESAFKMTVVSPVGAQGLMQLMPNTAKRASEEGLFAAPPDAIQRPDINVRLGSFYLSKLLGNFKGSLPLTAAGYNAGPHAVKRWLNTGAHETDLWIARIPFRETRHYVQRVLSNFARYQWLAGGNDNVTPLALALPTDTDIGSNAY
jgi:soluble lytic murein transglycosylase